jgi:hypothetical protein
MFVCSETTNMRREAILSPVICSVIFKEILWHLQALQFYIVFLQL